MEPKPIDIQGEAFPGFGRCIYCDSDGAGDGLRDEHIVPYCLGGNAIIEGASCRECEKVTSYLDGYLGRHVFYDYRANSKIQSRRPRPTHLSANIQIRETVETQTFPVGKHPYVTALPAWKMPGILRSVEPSTTFLTDVAHIFWYFPKELANAHPEVRAVKQVRMNHTTFARALMKIAYCHGVAQMGLDGFLPLHSREIILGTYPYVPHFVGCDPGDPPKPEPKRLHVVQRSSVEVGGSKLWLMSIRLFANSGTKDLGMPIYEVVIGAPQSDL